MANTAYGSFMPVCGLTLEKYFTLNRYQTPDIEMHKELGMKIREDGLDFEKETRKKRTLTKSVTPEASNLRKT